MPPEATPPEVTTPPEATPPLEKTVGAAAGDTVPGADYARVVAEAEAAKKAAAKYKEQIDADKTTRMKEQNQWKELAEARETELATLRQNNERIQTSFLDEKKFSTVKTAALALGIRPEAISDLENLDLNDVQIETTSTGKINILGADKFAERLKTLKPHWFAPKGAPEVNANGTRVVDSNGVITTDTLMILEKEGRKSGDLTKYHEAHKKFQTQRAASGRR